MSCNDHDLSLETARAMVSAISVSGSTVGNDHLVAEAGLQIFA